MIQLCTTTMTEILYRVKNQFLDETITEEEKILNIGKFLGIEVEGIREYCNSCFQTISQDYNCIKLSISVDLSLIGFCK